MSFMEAVMFALSAFSSARVDSASSWVPSVPSESDVRFREESAWIGEEWRGEDRRGEEVLTESVWVPLGFRLDSPRGVRVESCLESAWNAPRFRAPSLAILARRISAESFQSR